MIKWYVEGKYMAMVTGTELFAGIMREIDETIKGYHAASRETKIRQKLKAAGFTDDSLQSLQAESLDQKLRSVCSGLVTRLGLERLGINLNEQSPTEALQPDYRIAAQFNMRGDNPLYPPLMTGADIGEIILSDEYNLELNSKQDPVALIVSFKGEGTGHQGANYNVSVSSIGVISVSRGAVSQPRCVRLLNAIVTDLIKYQSPPAQDKV